MQGVRLYHCRSRSHGIATTIAAREAVRQTTGGHRLLQKQRLFHSSNFNLDTNTAPNKWPSLRAPKESKETQKQTSTMEATKNGALADTGVPNSTAETSTISRRILSASRVALSKATRSASHLLSLAATKTSESAKIAASKAAESARSLGQTISEIATTAAVSTAESIQTKTTAFFRSLRPRLFSFVRSSTMMLIQSVQNTLQFAANRLMTNVQTRVVRPISEYIDSTGGSAARWMWWWSLAAVGVYGVATTVPKELIRVVFEEKKMNKENGLSTKSEQVDK